MARSAPGRTGGWRCCGCGSGRRTDSPALNRARSATPAATPPPSTLVAAAGAIDARKIYGVGDAAVRALDNVTVSFEPGRFTVILEPRAN